MGAKIGIPTFSKYLHKYNLCRPYGHDHNLTKIWYF